MLTYIAALYLCWGEVVSFFSKEYHEYAHNSNNNGSYEIVLKVSEYKLLSEYNMPVKGISS